MTPAHASLQVASASALPAEASEEPPPFQLIVVQDSAAAQLTASRVMGCDIDDEQAVQRYYQSPVTAKDEVFQLVRGFRDQRPR